jgi:TfoX/Sxy family transcriptional regulator of competence genes
VSYTLHGGIVTNMDNAMKQYCEYVVHDVLGHIKGITARAMFGGYGLYLDGAIFGIIADTDELCLT